MPLPLNDIESELSYAYLHAIASRAGINCTIANRHADNYAIDANLEYFDDIPGTYIKDVPIRVQLKATKNMGVTTATHISYPYQGIKGYDKMRADIGLPYRILVVLFLSNNDSLWLTNSIDELIMKHAAYWVSLRGAPASSNANSETVYIPKANLLTPQSLITLCQGIGIGNIPTYTIP